MAPPDGISGGRVLQNMVRQDLSAVTASCAPRHNGGSCLPIPRTATTAAARVTGASEQLGG